MDLAGEEDRERERCIEERERRVEERLREGRRGESEGHAHTLEEEREEAYENLLRDEER